MRHPFPTSVLVASLALLFGLNGCLTIPTISGGPDSSDSLVSKTEVEAEVRAKIEIGEEPLSKYPELGNGEIISGEPIEVGTWIEFDPGYRCALPDGTSTPSYFGRLEMNRWGLGASHLGDSCSTAARPIVPETLNRSSFWSEILLHGESIYGFYPNPELSLTEGALVHCQDHERNDLAFQVLIERAGKGRIELRLAWRQSFPVSAEVPYLQTDASLFAVAVVKEGGSVQVDSAPDSPIDLSLNIELGTTHPQDPFERLGTVSVTVNGVQTDTVLGCRIAPSLRQP